MSGPSGLLVMGGDPVHATAEHYELVTELLAGSAGLKLHIIDEMESLTTLPKDHFDIIIMYRADREPSACPLDALWATVRKGTPYLSLHGAAFTVLQVPGGAAAIGTSYEEPHLRPQPFTVQIDDHDHPITAGVSSFTIEDEPYRLKPTKSSSLTVLASYSDHGLNLQTRHRTVVAQGRWPLIYTTYLGAGLVQVNALGHNRKALTHPTYRQLVVQGVSWLLATANP